MNETFIRTELLLGTEGLERLGRCRVALFGVGGVGGHVMEALVRSGIGAIDLFDMDTVAESNLNRQIIATRAEIGRVKVQVAKERILSINPDCRVEAHEVFLLPDTADDYDFSQYDYCIDAVDTVSGKMAIIKHAIAAGVPVISSMGAANKLDPARFRVSDIYKTSVDPLARVIRRECKKAGIRKLKVVWSDEEPVKLPDGAKGSVAFVPAVAGLVIAGEVIRDLVK